MNRPFGAEIELTGMTQEQAVRILRLLGFEVRNEAYNHETRTWWKIVPDGSVTGGFEVVSPILRGTEGLEALKTLIIGLDDAGGRIDRRCGLHVHFDGRDLALDDLRSIISRYAQYEAEIDAFMPPSRRGDENQYCRSMRGVAQRSAFQQARNVSQLIQAQPDRYFKVNLKPYLTQGSIEFRQHSGTLNAMKIHNWISFLDGFVSESCRLARGGQQSVEPQADISEMQPKLAELASLLMHHPGGLSSTFLQARLVVQAHSLRANMTYLRRKGLNIQSHRLNGETYYSISGAAQEHAPDSGVFSGVAPDVAKFYRNRAIVLNARTN